MKPSHRVWLRHHGVLPDWKGKREVIHHRNGDHSDNRIENLQLVTAGEHKRIHIEMDGSHWTKRPEVKAKMSASQIGKKHTEEHNRKIGDGNRGKVFSEERRAKISAALKGRKRGPHSEEHKAKISAGGLGKKRSDETRANIRAAWVIRKEKKNAMHSC